MLENIERPNMESISQVMTKYQQSDNKILIYLAKYTMSYLNRNTNQANQSFAQASDKQDINNQLNDMLTSMDNNIAGSKEPTTTKK